MANKIEMSLDDIIKSTRSLKIQRGGGAAPRRRSGNDKPQIRKNRPVQNAGGKKSQGGGSGAVLKGRNHGGIQKSKFPKADKNSTLTHGGRNRNGTGLKTASGAAGGPSKLLVSNLDYGVSERDIQELFGDFGPLKGASVHYDKSGRSLGTADIVFKRKADAVKAMKQYNGIPLDGRPMNIQLAISEVPSATMKSRLGTAAVRPPASVGNARGKSAAKGPKVKAVPRTGDTVGRRVTTKAPKPTAEELDADLDAYLKEKVTNTNVPEANVEEKVTEA